MSEELKTAWAAHDAAWKTMGRARDLVHLLEQQKAIADSYFGDAQKGVDEARLELQRLGVSSPP